MFLSFSSILDGSTNCLHILTTVKEILAIALGEDEYLPSTGESLETSPVNDITLYKSNFN